MFARYLDLTVHRDRLVLKDSKADATIDRRATEPFSCDHLTVARPSVLGALLLDMVRELHSGRRFLMFPSLRIAAGDTPLHEVEVAALRKIAEDAGFQKAEVASPTFACSDGRVS